MKILSILSYFAILCFSMSAWGMEEEKGQMRGIEIPSNTEKTGLNARVFPHPEQYKSWSDLEPFTTQTLHNFATGTKRGLLFIHALEDIMGARECFLKKWNETYPLDQRTMAGNGANFHEVFTNEEFVDHYIQFLLAERFLIAGSIVTYCDINKLNLTATFSPVSFVMVIPPECIAVTERQDAQTSVNYFPNETAVEVTRKGYNDKFQKNKDSITSLDFLIRFPQICSSKRENEGIAYQMNEVAVLGCATSGDEVYRPTVVAVLYNNAQKNGEFDYGNRSRNQCLVQAAESFATKVNLPFIISDACHSVSEYEMFEIANDWFENTQEMRDKLMHYYLFCYSSMDDKERTWISGFNMQVVRIVQLLISSDNLNQYALYFDSFNDKADSKLSQKFCKRLECETMAALNFKNKSEYYDAFSEQPELVIEKRKEIAAKIHKEDPRFQEVFNRQKHLRNKAKTFLLTDNELQSYGLKRPDEKSQNG